MGYGIVVISTDWEHLFKFNKGGGCFFPYYKCNACGEGYMYFSDKLEESYLRYLKGLEGLYCIAITIVISISRILLLLLLLWETYLSKII